MRSRTLRMTAVAVGLTLSGVGTAGPIVPVSLEGPPYSRGGMAHASAQPTKPCNEENDGEEVLMSDGKWRCRKDPNGTWRWAGPFPV